jgi:hypothetical protein
VSFDAGASTDPDGDPLTYRWTYGDEPAGTASALGPATTSHVYANRGTYKARVRVADGQGHVVTAAATVGIYEVRGTRREQVCGNPATAVPAEDGWFEVGGTQRELGRTRLRGGARRVRRDRTPRLAHHHHRRDP